MIDAWASKTLINSTNHFKVDLKPIAIQDINSYLRRVKPYKNINDPQRSFVSEFVELHSQKNPFFSGIDRLIDWKIIEEELTKVYTKGLTDRGAKAYSPLLLFKMHLISEWYQLSDTQTETMVNDSISSLKFCGLTLEDSVPGHSTLSRFKKELFDQGKMAFLLNLIQLQLESFGLRIKEGKGRIDARLENK